MDNNDLLSRLYEVARWFNIPVAQLKKCDQHVERTPSKIVYSDGSWLCCGCGAKGVSNG
jgi:hypothetical protein